MNKLILALSTVTLMLAAACASSDRNPETPASPEPAAAAPTASKSAPPPQIKSEPAPITEVAPSKGAAPPVAKPAPPAEVKEEMWVLKNGKLKGPGAWVPSKKISTVKNPKGNGTTSEICYNYGKFALVEVQSTDEKGSLDIFVRFPDEKVKNLCAADFSGKYHGLSVLEGAFAGVAGDYVLVDGIDASEGIVEFQIFSIETGKEAFRGSHHPTEEFAITRRGERSSLIFFPKIKSVCEMGTDPAACWKKTLEANGLKKAFPAPDCVAAFKKANVPLEESALITTRARVANLKEPKVELLGTRATCAPAP